MFRLILSGERWSELKGMMLQESIYNKPGLCLVIEGQYCNVCLGSSEKFSSLLSLLEVSQKFKKRLKSIPCRS